MKPKVMIITGRTLSGKTGTKYEHNLRPGMKVRTPEGLEGEIVGKGLAGMPEVQFADGSTTYEYPASLEILGQNVKATDGAAETVQKFNQQTETNQ